MKFAIKLALGILFVMAASLIATCVAQDACAMNEGDKQSAVNQTYTNLREQPWCEIFLFCGEPAGVYGSVGLNGANDSCPPELYSKYNATTIAEQYNATYSFINPASGRKYWLCDSLTMAISPNVRDFNGLKMHWWAEMVGTSEMPPYVPATIERNSVMTFDKGKPVFLLDDTKNGTTWILKNYATTVDPNMTYESLPTLGTKLNPPEGWNFRTETLDQDLTVKPVNGMARIMWDEFGQSYDALDPGTTNFQV
jgi:hypothetical protein